MTSRPLWVYQDPAKEARLAEGRAAGVVDTDSQELGGALLAGVAVGPVAVGPAPPHAPRSVIVATHPSSERSRLAGVRPAHQGSFRITVCPFPGGPEHEDTRETTVWIVGRQTAFSLPPAHRKLRRATQPELPARPPVPNESTPRQPTPSHARQLNHRPARRRTRRRCAQSRR
jgi:hypothetical protein